MSDHSPEASGEDNAQIVDAKPLVRKTIIVLEELPDSPGAFNLGLALSSQDPEQQSGDGDIAIPVTDIVAMALVDIVKTTPAAFVDRLKVLNDRIQAAAEAVKAGADPEEVAAIAQAPLGV